MKLIGTFTSPFVRKARVVLAEKKLDYQFVVEDVASPAARIGEYNPLGKVPCLVMEGGERIYDSRVIVEYLDALSPFCRLVPASGRERAEVKTWEALADGLSEAAVLIRMETHWSGRSDEQRSPAWIAHQQRKVDAALATMSRQLGDKSCCHGIYLSLADVAVGCALGYLDLRQPGLDWRGAYPNLQRLYGKLMQRPSFADTLAPD